MERKGLKMKNRIYKQGVFSKFGVVVLDNRDTVSKQEKERMFKLIKQQIRNKNYIFNGNEYPPALETLFSMWDTKRRLENAIKEQLDVDRLAYDWIKTTEGRS